MPVSNSQDTLSRFMDPPDTRLKDQLNIIKLDAIDLSDYELGPNNLAKRIELSKKLASSITTNGFFNVVNFGFDWDRIEKLRSVSQALMNIPDDEKFKYLAGARYKEDEVKYDNCDSKKLGGERGQGFKPKGYWLLKNGVRDSVTHYNFRNFLHDDVFFSEEAKENHPEIVRQYLNDISQFFKFLHEDVLRKISGLCDLILGIEEGTLYENYFKVIPNDFNNSGGGHGRFMFYEPFDNAAKSNKADDTWLRGHSDISGFSIITSQPMLSLQIKDYYTGEWKYVDHRPKSLIINIGDSMEFITGGYFKACVHRVFKPPQDQENFNRMVLISFINPSYTSVIDPEFLNSPVLKELGYTRSEKLKNWDKITFNEWDSVKGNLLGKNAVGERNTLEYYGRFIERWHSFNGET